MQLLALALAPALAAGPTDLLAGLRLGQGPAAVEAALRAAGAGCVERRAFDQPGAFASGALAPPGLLALLHRADVKPPFFDRLPRSGPSFVTACHGGARAAYAFVDDKLWALAITLPAAAVAPRPDPFDPDRLAPLDDALRALCPQTRAAGVDEHRNPVAWTSPACAGGAAHLWYDLTDRDAALQLVVHPR
jgi:hypothetical protein